jgi:hypothetical protein
MVPVPKIGTLVPWYTCTVRTYVRTYVSTSVQPGRPPVEPAGADGHSDRPKGGNAGAGARAGPHACEDCGGDPRCRHRCRVGTVVYRDVFYADNAH